MVWPIPSPVTIQCGCLGCGAFVERPGELAWKNVVSGMAISSFSADCDADDEAGSAAPAWTSLYWPTAQSAW